MKFIKLARCRSLLPGRKRIGPGANGPGRQMFLVRPQPFTNAFATMTHAALPLRDVLARLPFPVSDADSVRDFVARIDAVLFKLGYSLIVKQFAVLAEDGLADIVIAEAAP